MAQSLTDKYNVSGPRYTSYPPVPFWHHKPTLDEWKQSVQSTFRATNDSEGISLYLHLPFCESLCTYCGCNKRITKNHAVEKPYIDALLEEWSIYLSWFHERPVIREIHLGGGTPTFFSAENLEKLIAGLLADCDLHPDYAFSVEGHPNNTTTEHLEALSRCGFTRLSLGIQDFDPEVQRIVNRVQSFEQVKKVTEAARKTGYTSINYDLIYGLPLQTMASVEDTIEKVKLLKPERIAFYSYAHVPWKSPGQRMFTEKDLPDREEKRALYDNGKEMLEAAGYVEIGMDHFALPEDELCIAAQEGRLHRNFMGYTTGQTKLLIGLGASSISDSWGAFVQNDKKVEDYKSQCAEGIIGTANGHLLSESDQILRQHIVNLMTRFQTDWERTELQHPLLFSAEERLAEMIADGLVEFGPYNMKVTNSGKPFVRNICMAIDEYIAENKIGEKMFSKTV